MIDDRKDLPSPDSPNFLGRVREVLQTYMGSQGDPLKRGVMIGDLTDAGIVALRPGYKGGKYPIAGIGDAIGTGLQGPAGPPGPATPYEPDLTPPPTPTGFAVSSAISNIFIEHDAPAYTQGHGHARTVVYGVVYSGGALPVFDDAAEITEFNGTVFAYATNPATTWHLWIKWRSVDGVLSATPAGGVNGLTTTTGQDVSKLVLAMTGPGNPFTVVPAEVTLPDGSVVPAGTYTADAFIHNGQITNAKIANLAVDNAKIANLSVSKLTAGSIAVGQYIQSTSFVSGSSGWRIHGNGTAEFANAIVRGAIYATSGTFTGTLNASTINGGTINGTTVSASTINGGTINATQLNSVYVASAYITGAQLDIYGDGGTGYGYIRNVGKWWGDGNNGWVFSRNGNDGSVFAEIKAGAGRIWMASWGDYGIQFPGILMTGGGLTISQVDVINTLNVAGNAITVPVAVYTSGGFAPVAGVWTSAQAVGFNCSGGAIQVLGLVNFFPEGGAEGSSPGSCVLGLYRDGAQLQVSNTTAPGNLVGMIVDYPGAGYHVYELRVITGGASGTISNRTISLLEVKR
ncbi:hypothetical protein RD110_15565 [Rhodoferax koreense]|uniref:Tip attachment protein J central straight fiber domain-containing protein n=1 Tax=Rhodoferax koreensis TaxID=1842727 RepID=A0A1P8JXF9_9BURK|nr:hypothetical protein [Rhodoferax koreense]APW38440.1 hypothetical protein RD110_15565 [Rhodoferax koreense]